MRTPSIGGYVVVTSMVGYDAFGEISELWFGFDAKGKIIWSIGGRTDGVVGHEEEIHRSAGHRVDRPLVVRRFVVVHEAGDRAGFVDEGQGRHSVHAPVRNGVRSKH